MRTILDLTLDDFTARLKFALQATGADLVLIWPKDDWSDVVIVPYPGPRIDANAVRFFRDRSQPAPEGADEFPTGERWGEHTPAWNRFVAHDWYRPAHLQEQDIDELLQESLDTYKAAYRIVHGIEEAPV